MLSPKRQTMISIGDGTEITLTSGEIYFADGASSFSPKNPFDEDFEMLIHLIKR
jgi:hypothetical protein